MFNVEPRCVGDSAIRNLGPTDTNNFPSCQVNGPVPEEDTQDIYIVHQAVIYICLDNYKFAQGVSWWPRFAYRTLQQNKTRRVRRYMSRNQNREASSNSNNLTLAVFQDDKLAVNPFARVHANNVGRVYRVNLDPPFLKERASKDDVKVRFFGEVNGVGSSCPTNSNRPAANARYNTLSEPQQIKRRYNALYQPAITIVSWCGIEWDETVFQCEFTRHVHMSITVFEKHAN